MRSALCERTDEHSGLKEEALRSLCIYSWPAPFLWFGAPPGGHKNMTKYELIIDYFQ